MNMEVLNSLHTREQLESKMRKKVRINNTIMIILALLPILSLLGYLPIYSSREGSDPEALVVAVFIIQMIFIPFFPLAYQWFFTKKIWKEYLDDPVHDTPLDMERIHDVLTTFSLWPRKYHEKAVKDTTEQVKKLFYKGTLEGVFDYVTGEYYPPSVVSSRNINKPGQPLPPRTFHVERRTYPDRRDERSRDIMKALESDFSSMDVNTLGLYLEEIISKHGFITTLTPALNGYGWDIIGETEGEKVLVKLYKNPLGTKVGLKEARDVKGSMVFHGTTRAILVTNTTFTRGVLGMDGGFELWDGERMKDEFRELLTGKG